MEAVKCCSDHGVSRHNLMFNFLFKSGFVFFLSVWLRPRWKGILCAVLIIVGPAKAFGELMSLLSVPDLIGDALSDVTQSPFLLLMIIAVILIITGMFLESIAQIILLTPLLLPIVVALGIDPIVFGIVMVISCEVGFLTPPVGANLFVAARITNLGIDKISVAVLPFLFAYIAVLVFVSLFPDVVTWLPNLVYGKYGG